MRVVLAQITSTPDRAANVARVLRAVDEAAAAGAQVLVFPEVVLDRFFPALPGTPECRCQAAGLAEPIPGPMVDQLAARARQYQMVIVFNLYEVAQGDDGRPRFFDTSPVIDADGQLLGSTRMIHITDYEGFHEQAYYQPGDHGMPVYTTRYGKIGVAICYDRHYPEAMRALALGGAELVCIPQAGCLGEWPEGLYEAEVRTAAFQNGYFVALCNRVGVEPTLTFAGESFIVDPDGRVLTRGKTLEEDLVVADLDLAACENSHARRLFLRDRRPALYPAWVAPD